jgi:nucleotide-binding universal stress UspA family protein
MPQIKKILFPVDFSENCIGAARYVESLAGHFEAEVMLLHAVTMGEHNLAEELLPSRRAELDKFLAGDFKYFTTIRECVVADPEAAIAEATRSWNPDLIMTPTHGLGFFHRHILGSVAAQILNDFQCAVWTSVHAEIAPLLEDIHCRRILCAPGLDERSLFIRQWADWFAFEFEAEIKIVCPLEAPEDWVRDVANAAAEFGPDILIAGRPLRDSFDMLLESACPVITV